MLKWLINICLLLFSMQTFAGFRIEPRDFQFGNLADLDPLLREQTGVSRIYARGDCQGDKLSASIRSGKNFSDTVHGIKSYFSRCEDDISRKDEEVSFTSLIEYSRSKYYFGGNKKIQPITIHFPDQRKMRAFLLVKNDQKKRPFVIYKCGVYCDIGENVTFANHISELFDESPFHLLLLPNVTGADFISDNNAVAVGGFDEGKQIFELAQFLRTQSQWKNQISTVQVVGSSLGSHGTLYSALYASKHHALTGQKTVDAVLATCPVVNLQNSLDRLYNGDFVSQLAYQYTFNFWTNIFQKSNVLKTLFTNQNLIDEREQLKSQLAQASAAYYSRLSRENVWPAPFAGQMIDGVQKLYEVNDFTKYVDQVTIPTFLISSKNDPLVWSDENTKLLPETNPWVQKLVLKRGNHCGFQTSYGHERWARLLRDYVISNDPSWKNSTIINQLDIEQLWNQQLWPMGYQFSNSALILRADWKVNLDSNEATLNLQQFSPYRIDETLFCNRFSPYDAEENNQGFGCLDNYVLKFPMGEILNLLQEAPPTNQFEASRLTKLLNTRSVLADEQGENFLRSGKKPKYINYEKLD